MALTRSFKDTVQARVQADPSFRAALLGEGIQALLAGDVDTGKAVLRDYIKATTGFEALGAALDLPPKSLLRMFGPGATPRPKTCSRSSATSRSDPISICWSPPSHCPRPAPATIHPPGPSRLAYIPTGRQMAPRDPPTAA